MTLYFAYGSNMATDLMKSKCPGSRLLGRARLDGYRLAFSRRSIRTGTGVANMVRDDPACVWGVLYEATEECLEALDRKEGHPWAYERREVTVVLDDGRRLRAATYVVAHPEADEVPPSAEYLRGMTSAANEQGLPDSYIESLRGLAPAP